MNNQLTLVLWNSFPKLYRGKDLSLMESLIPFGFECEDGWFMILWNLSKELENINNLNLGYTIEATQVKEKYGGLRFYVSGYNDAVSTLINRAEHQSYRTCEICGSPGRLNDGSWKMVRCGRHARGY